MTSVGAFMARLALERVVVTIKPAAASTIKSSGEGPRIDDGTDQPVAQQTTVARAAVVATPPTRQAQAAVNGQANPTLTLQDPAATPRTATGQSTAAAATPGTSTGQSTAADATPGTSTGQSTAADATPGTTTGQSTAADATPGQSTAADATPGTTATQGTSAPASTQQQEGDTGFKNAMQGLSRVLDNPLVKGGVGVGGVLACAAGIPILGNVASLCMAAWHLFKFAGSAMKGDIRGMDLFKGAMHLAAGLSFGLPLLAPAAFAADMALPSTFTELSPNLAPPHPAGPPVPMPEPK